MPFIVGVAGGASAGKRAACHAIVESLKHARPSAKVEIIDLRDFFREFTAKDEEEMASGTFDFDHPFAYDFDALVTTVVALKAGHSQVKIPKYNLVTRKRKDKARIIMRADVVLIHGMMVLYKPELRSLLDLAVYLDVDADRRLSRRVLASAERNESLETVLSRYVTYVKPAHEQFVRPTKADADLIVPRGEENSVAIELIVQYIMDLLEEEEKRAEKVAVPEVHALSRSSSTQERTMKRRSSLIAAAGAKAILDVGSESFETSKSGKRSSVYNEIPK